MLIVKKMLFCLALLLHSGWLFADIRLPSIISSNMVLQQNTQVPIWGWADLGEEISVDASWLEESVSVVANAKGEWLMKLPSPAAGGPYKIIIIGNNSIVLDNILSGEVWLASGQSNMAMAVERCKNAEDEITSANYPDIRLFHVVRTWADKPQSDCSGYWVEVTPETIKKFSGVAFFFGRNLYKELKVPIGIISASKGGSPIESWMAKEVLKADPDFSPVFEMWEKWEAEYPEMNKKYLEDIALWKKQKDANQGLAILVKPPMPNVVHKINRPHKRPNYNYNGMIAPISPYAIKGVIWYQGEDNVYRPSQYIKLFQLLITSWRNEWELGDFPFYYVQIAPYRYEEGLALPPFLREAQAMALSLSNTGMVVTTDIGNVGDIHPINKQEVGSRIALWALSKTYGYKGMVYSGPIYNSSKVEGGKIRLFFTHVGSGLLCKGDSLTDFEIAGADRKFVKAQAYIKGTTVVVFNPEITHPIAVRFGWSIISTPNFYNEEGLPTAPFRTDTWE